MAILSVKVRTAIRIIAMLACCLALPGSQSRLLGQTHIHSPRNPRAKALSDEPSAQSSSPTDADEQMFAEIYRNFFKTYRLGPADKVAIRVVGQPDYSIERA